MDDHVRILFEDLGGVRGDFHVPRSVRGADDFTEIAAGFRGIGINRADDFKSLLLAHQFDEGSADGANSVLNDANPLFHDALRALAPGAHCAEF